MREGGSASDLAGATITIGDGITEGGNLSAGAERLRGVWRVEVWDDEKGLIWDETLENLITTEGGNDLLSVFTGGTFATLYASGFTAGSPTLTATYASPVVTEMTTAQMASRIALVWGAPAGKSIVGTAALPILTNATITGIMAMKGGAGVTTVRDTAASGGKLLSEGTLSVAQVISTSGTLNLSYTLSV